MATGSSSKLAHVLGVPLLPSVQDLFDSLDLSDNEIVKLEGFPLLKRVTTLLLNNNRITRVSTSVGGALEKP